MNRRPAFRRQGGYSFIELMMVTLGMAIIATMAVPGLQRARESYRLTTARDEIISSLEYARSEAVKRDSVATVVFNNSGAYTVQYPDVGTTVTFTYNLPSGVSFAMPAGATSLTIRYASSGKATLTASNGIAASSIGLTNTAGQRNIAVSLAGNITSNSSGS
ncbi:MAG: GspH/FimT family pseudopilin [Blastocatellia bacterium]